MKIQEFHDLKIGDKLQYRGRTFQVVMIEQAYDWEAERLPNGCPKSYTWKAHFQTGQNAQDTDNISELKLIEE